MDQYGKRTNVRLPLVRFRIGGTNTEFVGGA